MSRAPNVLEMSLPSGPGESSQAWNPPVESTHVEDVEMMMSLSLSLSFSMQIQIIRLRSLYSLA
jgi:hypothetical protein